jgi:hypothetical protein
MSLRIRLLVALAGLFVDIFALAPPSSGQGDTGVCHKASYRKQLTPSATLATVAIPHAG